MPTVTLHYYLHRQPGPSQACFIGLTDPGQGIRYISPLLQGDYVLPVVPGTLIDYWSHTGVLVPSARITISNQTDIWYLGDNWGASTILTRSETVSRLTLPDWADVSSADMAYWFGRGMSVAFVAWFAVWLVKWVGRTVANLGKPPHD